MRIAWPDGERPDLVARPDAAEGRIPVPLDGLPPGRFRLQVRLEDARGTSLAEESCTLVRRAPAESGNDVQVDRWRGGLKVNGAPLFPYGHVSFSGAGALPMMAELGANTLFQWGRFADIEKLAALHAEAERLGLFVVEGTDYHINQTRIAPDPNPVRLYDPAWPEAVREGIRDRLPGLLQGIAPRRSLLAWTSLDEPAYDVHRDVLRELKQELDSRDGRHPNLTVFCRALPADWADGFDIGCLDIYLGGGSDNEFKHFLGWLDKARNVARSVQKPLWVVLTSEEYSGSPHLLPPAVQRAQTYLALIHDAKGLFYFIWPLRHRDTHAEFRRLFAELRELSPALLRHAPPQSLERLPEGGEKPVYARIFEFPDGERVLLAANAGSAPASVTWTVAPAEKTLRVSDRFRPGSDYPVSAGAFTDRLEGHGTRAYRLAGAGPGGPVHLRLAVECEPARGDNLVLDPQVRDPAVWSGLSGDGPARHEAGAGCLRLERAAGTKTVVRVKHVPIELKPATRYRVSFRVRGEFESGPFDGYAGPDVSVWSTTRNRSLVMCQSFYRLNQTPRDTREWEPVQGAFQTGPEPETAVLSVQASPTKYVGTAWVSDLVLRPIGPVETSRNLLPNSGFEHATLPGYPDRWFSLTAGYRSTNDLTGNPGARLALDETVRHEGTVSLRLRGHHQLQTSPTRNSVSLDPDKTYTLSLFLKADRPGQEVWMKIAGPADWTKVTVGPDWTRASCTGTAARAWSYLGVYLRTESALKQPDDPPTFWLDAAQLEEGTEPTDYTPDTYQP